MSEKPNTPEQKTFGRKHESFLGWARYNLGSISIGGITGRLGLGLVSLLGVTNPWYLLSAYAVSALGGWLAARKAP